MDSYINLSTYQQTRSSSSPKMGYFYQCRNLMCFLLVLAMVLSLMPSLQARPLSGVEVGRYRTEEQQQKLRELAAMLPKGVPIPPSGPSPGIN